MPRTRPARPKVHTFAAPFSLAAAVARARMFAKRRVAPLVVHSKTCRSGTSGSRRTFGRDTIFPISALAWCGAPRRHGRVPCVCRAKWRRINTHGTLSIKANRAKAGRGGIKALVSVSHDVQRRDSARTARPSLSKTKPDARRGQSQPSPGPGRTTGTDNLISPQWFTSHTKIKILRSIEGYLCRWRTKWQGRPEPRPVSRAELYSECYLSHAGSAAASVVLKELIHFSHSSTSPPPPFRPSALAPPCRGPVPDPAPA